MFPTNHAGCKTMFTPVASESAALRHGGAVVEIGRVLRTMPHPWADRAQDATPGQPARAPRPASLLVRHGEVEVRPARLLDWPELHAQVPKLFPDVNEATLGHWLRNERTTLLVAEVDGVFAGFCHLRVRRQGAVLWVNYIGVVADQRRIGVGHELLRRVQELAAAWGCMRVELDVVVRNAVAVALYERAGYRCITTLVDDAGGIKYRYRREVQAGRVESLTAPSAPPRWQRALLRVLYAVWISGPQRARTWLKGHTPRSTRPDQT